MTVASEDAGFWIKDMLAWHYTKRAQAKAFTLDHFIDKKPIPQKEKERLKNKINGRKTPQLKPAFEPLMLAQKPLEGTFINNFDKWAVGLIDTSITMDGHFPSNVLKVEKTEKKDKHGHPTQKPVALLEHLIKIFTQEGQTVLDPFIGSGSTAVACYKSKRKVIGYELESKYTSIARERIQKEVARAGFAY
ncbi:type II methyltransferase M.HindIII-like [Ylistrum balloti]|uniref:type II methyltransferase M.HindIII-like n=1 Tax=Ylistrum balloti TaxID=509963 RepID=UPI002905BB03|nr:type II methyltransferase M.HindIII-like [Ylistrum balloti]